MVKYKLAAVIPTVQYGNLQPEVELEGEDLAVLHEQAEAHIQKIWDRFGERPLVKKTSGGVELRTFTGETIFFDSEAHRYTDQAGNVLLSGSAYAEKQGKPFDKANVVAAASKAWKVDADELGKLWDINAKISTEYGSAIHTALETYHLYKDLGAIVQQKKELEYNYALPKIPYIRDAVISFDEQFGTDALTEVIISDVKSGKAGAIDRLTIVDMDKKVCRIGDYKTNFELDEKKLATYAHQLSFYASILQAHGWTVEGLDLYHFSDGWTHHELAIQPIV
jgi:hypothetical protein